MNEPSWPQRLKYLAVPLALTGWGTYIFAIVTWPTWAGFATLATLLVGTVYLALFVWPYENES